MIADSASAGDALPLAHSDITILKVNGDYRSPNFKNTIEELDSYGEEIDRRLHEVFTQYGLVVCGWSAKYDTALGKALEEAGPAPFAAYWLHKGEIEPEAETLIACRAAEKVEIEDAGVALGGIEATVDALSEAAGQQILNADMAVARLKRFLPEESHWIRLHNLVAGETQNAIAALGSIETREHMYSPPIGIQERMQAYETAMATLLRLLVVGTRFSNRQDHDNLWAECVDRLANRSMHLRGGGDAHVIQMQFYPALLALHAIALGSAAADRVEPIAHTLTAVVLNRPLPTAVDHGPLPVIASAESMDDRYFPDWNGRNSLTPSSDHLLGVLRPSAADVIPGDERLEDFFDESEYLLGLAGQAQLSPLGLDYLTAAGRATTRSAGEDSYPDGLTRRREDTLIDKGVFEDSNQLAAARSVYQQKFDDLRNQHFPFRQGP